MIAPSATAGCEGRSRHCVTQQIADWLQEGRALQRRRRSVRCRHWRGSPGIPSKDRGASSADATQPPSATRTVRPRQAAIHGRTPTSAGPVDGVLHQTNAEWVANVEIRGLGHAHALQGLQPGAGHRACVPKVRDIHGAADPMGRSTKMIIVLLGLVERRQVVPIPGALPRATDSTVPVGIVLSLAPHIDHCVDSASPAKNPALRHDRMHHQIGVLGKDSHSRPGNAWPGWPALVRAPTSARLHHRRWH